MKQSFWVLAALAAGIGLGAWLHAGGDPNATAAAQTVSVVGALWLDALRMTLAPLIFAVLVSAIAQMAQTAAAGPLARRALALYAGLVLLAAVYSVLSTPALLSLWPPDSEGVRAALQSAGGDAAPAAKPVALEAWLRSLVPTNVIAAAAEDAVLPLVVFACLFGFAVTRLAPERRKPLVDFFQAAADAMLVIVQWVLALAPIGVFGLALSLGLSTGLDTVGVLAHYVAVVSLVTIGIILVAMILGLVFSGLNPAVFLRALFPVQVIAASTQSSLASLPAMLAAAIGPMGVSARVAEFALPLAVAVFRMTSPVANLAVVLFLAHIYGVQPQPLQLAAAILVAFAVSVSSVGLPGQTSFFASVAPICLAVGVPVELLPLLLAVEVIPDVFRTIGNVTADLSATAILNRANTALEKKTNSG
ncbi:MAG: dicarboxylate/amino acid:cation symporter [Caulobacterales bacterium]|jgi:Na+/H+-dicarboxylate symporter